MKIYTEVSIHKHPTGVGMWRAGELRASPGNSFIFCSNLLANIENESMFVMQIEDAIGDPDFITAGIENIWGKIYNEPTLVFARIDNWKDLSYFGIEESEVPETYFD